MRKRTLVVLTVALAALCGVFAVHYFVVERPGLSLEEADYITLLNPSSSVGIVRQPIADVNRRVFSSMRRLPVYDPSSLASLQIDLRGRDLSGADVGDRLRDLLYANFDTRTIWPGRLPAGFDPRTIMDVGKNPGLLVRELHRRGITGRGVGLAIIDQSLLVEHREYRDRLRLYEEIHVPSRKQPSAQMHGPAVASIAVGLESGVAPEADLYYIASVLGYYLGHERFRADLSWLGQSMNRVLDINKTLPADHKIRVMSISVGWVGNTNMKGYKEAEQALERARREDVFVLTTTLEQSHGVPLCGLERAPLQNPDDLRVFVPGQWWRYEYLKKKVPEKMLLVPMASRCTASPTGPEDFTFFRDGGESWSVPYLAGLYALACQVRPDTTPDVFLQTALETGDASEFTWEGRKYPVRMIVNPVRLLEQLQAKQTRR